MKRKLLSILVALSMVLSLFGTALPALAVDPPPPEWQNISYTPGIDLKDVWGTSANIVYAVGSGGTIIRWNGTAWNIETAPAAAGGFSSLTSIWGTGPADIWAGGNFNDAYHYNGTA